MRKVYVEVRVKMVIRANDDQDIGEVIGEMEYSFDSQSDGADIEDTEIVDWDIVDSK